MKPKLEEKLGVSFKNPKLLKQAFIHRSYLNEHPGEGFVSNERLEFLGDAILEFLVSNFLYQKFPTASEGKLTSLRAKLVCERSLAIIAEKLSLGQFLLLSKGEDESNGRKNTALLGNTFEALLGAIYLDQGLASVERLLKVHLLPTLEDVQKYQDFKSDFQARAQERLGTTPVYQVLKELGPDHNKHFTVGVFLKQELWGRGVGKSKQKAEEQAAKKALAKMRTAC